MYTDILETELLRLVKTTSTDSRVFFFHSPLCGTCALARRMLDVVMATLPNVHIYGCNINLMPERAATWKIHSIPCLTVVHQGNVLAQKYAFNSVPEVYTWLKPYASPMKRNRKSKKL